MYYKKRKRYKPQKPKKPLSPYGNKTRMDIVIDKNSRLVDPTFNVLTKLQKLSCEDSTESAQSDKQYEYGQDQQVLSSQHSVIMSEREVDVAAEIRKELLKRYRDHDIRQEYEDLCRNGKIKGRPESIFCYADNDLLTEPREAYEEEMERLHNASSGQSDYSRVDACANFDMVKQPESFLRAVERIRRLRPRNENFMDEAPEVFEEEMDILYGAGAHQILSSQSVESNDEANEDDVHRLIDAYDQSLLQMMNPRSVAAIEEKVRMFSALSRRTSSPQSGGEEAEEDFEDDIFDAKGFNDDLIETPEIIERRAINALRKLWSYLQQESFYPYFVSSDDARHWETICRLLPDDFEVMSVTDFFGDDDALLDLDRFLEVLISTKKKLIVFGLGEYIRFSGQSNILDRIQYCLCNRKVVFICRGITHLLDDMVRIDFNFKNTRYAKLDARSEVRVGLDRYFSASIVQYSLDMNVPTAASSFKAFLKLVEGGTYVTQFSSDMPLRGVKFVRSFYKAVVVREPELMISEKMLSEEQWREYFFDNDCRDYPPEHWRTFVAGLKHDLSDLYLLYVSNNSISYEDYLRNLVFSLIELEDYARFAKIYMLRKAHLKGIFTAENRSGAVSKYLNYLVTFITGGHVEEPLRYLTDNTAPERRAMIEVVQGKAEVPALLETNYPALGEYLTEYDFGHEEITGYFRQYKRIKLCSVDDEGFKAQVRELAIERPYNRFETRQAILDRANPSAKLYWLDALGVEFLSYIDRRADEAGLVVKIEVARAELPTLTAFNRNFFDEWQGDKFAKNSKLDALKHSLVKLDAVGKYSAPTYIDDELTIISEVIMEIKMSLTTGETKEVILTSDHGASRLAVLYGRESTYKMLTVGEHSGRCCRVNAVDAKPDCATEENGYWVLANYDRFVGGRMSTVEVHGGATLEEVLVPVVTFFLPGHSSKTPVNIRRRGPPGSVRESLSASSQSSKPLVWARWRGPPCSV